MILELESKDRKLTSLCSNAEAAQQSITALSLWTKFKEVAAAAGDRDATGGYIKEQEEGTKMGASERGRREERGKVMDRVIQTVQILTDRDCKPEQKVS